MIQQSREVSFRVKVDHPIDQTATEYFGPEYDDGESSTLRSKLHITFDSNNNSFTNFLTMNLRIFQICVLFSYHKNK